mmetsp:Transcript_64628/g.127770  ORF Transcript_64628/g.127770 Transcript_64628/m.127770 type:complete len:335 (-) Transcript_64628:52-1056(-)|eukprot:CAMPEP_0172713370 /NCGR_PEP_ID=MMETSP1074-20121228/62260_1 /TAXON_ID=2916 /ORGANISM="Ceratium fusus, Strain PA161109" /LENGTH=334 /DNA_ID=CAMNT_0013537451 /DNA_START=36 /DNA_END=1040 /DNA_ORIENTATION=+
MTALVDSLKHAEGLKTLTHKEKAKALFAVHLPCDGSKLHRVYLRLALRHHPDKKPEVERNEATMLFQAISAVYEELMHPYGRLIKRIKTSAAIAAELGDVAELKRLLEELPSRANEEDNVGAFPLMSAARAGCIEAAEMLLQYDANLHARTPFGWSALHYAGLSDHGDMVRWLVGMGAKVTSHELTLVAYGGYAKSLEALMDLFSGNVSEVRSSDAGKTLLHLVCVGMLNFANKGPQRYLRCADMLLQRSVPVDAIDCKKGRTPLQTYVGNPKWLEREFECSPAHLALVQMLCTAGASATVKDHSGSSAISLAKSQGLMTVCSIMRSFPPTSAL